MRASLVINGVLVGATSAAAELGRDVEGRAVLGATVPLQATLMVTIDPAAVEAIHARRTYGFAHLRAILDELPPCRVNDCMHVATRALQTDSSQQPEWYGCDEHDGTGFVELPYAPAVRHIEGYVMEWEKNRKVPEGES